MNLGSFKQDNLLWTLLSMQEFMRNSRRMDDESEENG